MPTPMKAVFSLLLADCAGPRRTVASVAVARLPIRKCLRFTMCLPSRAWFALAIHGGQAERSLIAPDPAAILVSHRIEVFEG